ncbi:MAG: DMT family transporter [Bacteroidaceae bacterium]|nr:DMT family transporter [Bacteroidaceae bacterium]
MQYAKHLPFLLALLVVFIWGETFVSSKILLTEGLMPADIFLYRFTIAYAGMVIISHRRMWAKNIKHELMMMATGVTGGSMYFLTENMALKYSTASNVAIIVGITPLMTALLLALFYKDERMNRRQIMASMIAFLGLVLVVLNGQLILHLNPIGDALAFSAAVSWGLYSLLMKPLTNQYEPSFLTRKVFAYGLITIIPWFLLVQPLNANLSLLTHPAVWMNLLWLSLVASLTCFLMWNWVLPRLGIVKATNVVYLQSIFTMLVSFLILNERITWMAIVGTLTLIGGMYLINKFEKK